MDADTAERRTSLRTGPRIRLRRLLEALPLLVLPGAPLLPAADAPSPIQFHDITRETGIRFVHTDGSSGRRYIVETVAAGLATFDYDGDGDLDIHFLNGTPLPGAATEPRPRHALYRNDGNWKFTEVTEPAGVGDGGYGLGVCVGDYDNDGDPDLYLNNYGPNVLFRNNGDGTFTDVTRAAGVGNGDKVGAGASFLDIDRDGDLDLYVANYIDFTPTRHQTRFVNGHPAYVGPMAYGPVPDTLFRNNGDGTFTDISRESGIAAHAGTGMGIVCADYDDDGDTDIVVGNDAMANFVWRNDGTGRFEEVGLLSGLAYDRHGVGQGTMGLECGDFDNDGRLDFHSTSYQKQWPSSTATSAEGCSRTSPRPPAPAPAPFTWSNGATASSISTTTATATSFSPAAISRTTSKPGTTPPGTPPGTFSSKTTAAAGSPTLPPGPVTVSPSNSAAAAPPSRTSTTTATSTS
jgi:hypothetical protein